MPATPDLQVFKQNAENMVAGARKMGVPSSVIFAACWCAALFTIAKETILNKNETVNRVEKHVYATTDTASASAPISLQNDTASGLVRENSANRSREKSAEGVGESHMPTLEQFRDALEQLQYSEKKLHVALCGTASSGKSSLINALRGLSNNEAGSAAVKAAECTLRRTRYLHPDKDHKAFSRFVWYDCPGAGVTNTPAKGYFNSQGLFLFDFIILVWDNSFSELDIEIVRNCILFKVPFAVVRSKADQHIENEMKSQNYDLYEAGSDNPNFNALLSRAKTEIKKVSDNNFETEKRRCGSFTHCKYLEKTYVVSNRVLQKLVCRQQDIVRYAMQHGTSTSEASDKLLNETPSVELPGEIKWQRYMMDERNFLDDLFTRVTSRRLDLTLSRELLQSLENQDATMAKCYENYKNFVTSSVGTMWASLRSVAPGRGG